MTRAACEIHLAVSFDIPIAAPLPTRAVNNYLSLKYQTDKLTESHSVSLSCPGPVTLACSRHPQCGNVQAWEARTTPTDCRSWFVSSLCASGTRLVLPSLSYAPRLELRIQRVHAGSRVRVTNLVVVGPKGTHNHIQPFSFVLCMLAAMG